MCGTYASEQGHVRTHGGSSGPARPRGAFAKVARPPHVAAASADTENTRRAGMALAVSKLPWEAMDPQAGTAPGRPPSTTNFFNVETAAFGSRRSEMTCIRVSMRSCKRSMAT